MKLSPLFLTLSLVLAPALTATAAAPSNADGAIRASVSSLGAQSSLQSVRPSPIAGLKEVQADGQILYFTDDGQYMLVGDLYKVGDRSNLTELARSRVRAQLLQTSDPSTHIVFGDKNAKKVIYVFTDTSCGYCQRFHEQVPTLTAAGVRVEYLAWPRGGDRSPDLGAMESAWCSKDRRTAYETLISGKTIAPVNCTSPVMAQHALGEKLGIQGTPAIYTADGRQLGGYVHAKTILQALSTTP